MAFMNSKETSKMVPSMFLVRYYVYCLVLILWWWFSADLVKSELNRRKQGGFLEIDGEVGVCAGRHDALHWTDDSCDAVSV